MYQYYLHCTRLLSQRNFSKLLYIRITLGTRTRLSVVTTLVNRSAPLSTNIAKAKCALLELYKVVFIDLVHIIFEHDVITTVRKVSVENIRHPTFIVEHI